MSALRAELPPLPSPMRDLRVHRGYPVPWFVADVDGEPDFRIVDGPKMLEAIKGGLCWICGKRLGRGDRFAFVVGPEEEIDDEAAPTEANSPGGNHQLQIVVPGGQLGANELERDRWHVEFEGTLSGDGLRFLVADVLMPLLGKRAPSDQGDARRAAEGM